MNFNCKKFILALLLTLTVFLAAGCGQELTPYDVNDGENYNVSVKYDANGGTFTTNTSVIVDSYNIAELTPGADGKVQIPLLAPDNSLRGNDAFTAVNNGYFLAGWYAERTESTDEAGNTVYTYSGKWDFENSRVSVDPNGSYSASEPVATLYAAWVPLFEVRFHDLETGEYLQSHIFDPAQGQTLQVPALNEETGAMEMFRFPERSGYTFQEAFLDQEGTKPVTEVLTHPGTVDAATGTAVDGVLDVYIRWLEGEWYHIYTAQQLVENASVSGCYEIHADLDFAEQIWPTSLMYGNFTGTINGNGHTIGNVTVEQTNNSKTSAGLFGSLGETASLKDVTFRNVTFTIKSGTRMAGTSFGLLAGSVSSAATLENVAIAESKLLIHGNAYFGTDDYTIGLVCGMGQTDMDDSGITAGVVESDTLFVLVNDGYVTLTDVPQETVLPQEETAAEETVPETQNG